MDLKNLQQITNNNYKQRISFNASENSYSKINKLLRRYKTKIMIF